MREDFTADLGFLVYEVGRLFAKRFDRAARGRLGLSRAQCRLIVTVATQAGRQGLSQAALAELMEMTPMAVAKLCDRMQEGGWIRRQSSASDARVRLITLETGARKALRQAARFGRQVREEAVANIDGDELARLIASLQRVHANLIAADAQSRGPAPVHQGGAAQPGVKSRRTVARGRRVPGAGVTSLRPRRVL